MQDSIKELEKKFAFQEKLLSELNDVILQQDRRIKALEVQVARLKDKPHDETLVKPLSQEERPPHY